MNAQLIAHYTLTQEVPAELTARLDQLTDTATVETPAVSIGIGREGGAWIAAVIDDLGTLDILRIVAPQRPDPLAVLTALTVVGTSSPTVLGKAWGAAVPGVLSLDSNKADSLRSWGGA